MKTGDPLVLKSFISGIATGFIGFVLAIAGPLAPTNALSVDTARDCDNNAVVHCGAVTTTELHHKYNQSKEVQSIYSNFGISDTDMGQLTNTAVAGSVTKGGRVIVNGETVATDATTAGRQNMPGSTSTITDGFTYFTRPPSASFQQNSLPAFVVMQDGVFDFAIIASCGNPVTATARPKPTPAPEQTAPSPAPTQTPVAPEETPVTPASSTSSSSSSSTSTAVANVNVTQPEVTTPVVPVAPAAPVATAPASLPNTGFGDALLVTILSAIAGTAGHLLYVRRKAHF
jgi:hypothetical protein